MTNCTSRKGGYADTLCTDLESVAQRQTWKGGVKAVLVTDRVATPVLSNGMSDWDNKEALGRRLTIHKTSGRLLMKFCPFCGGGLVDLEALVERELG